MLWVDQIVFIFRFKNEFLHVFNAQIRGIICFIPKKKFSAKDFICKCDQIHRKLWICLHFLKKSLTKSFIFCTVLFVHLERARWLKANIDCISYLVVQMRGITEWNMLMICLFDTVLIHLVSFNIGMKWKISYMFSVQCFFNLLTPGIH